MSVWMRVKAMFEIKYGPQVGVDSDIHGSSPNEKGGPLPDRPFVSCDEPPDQRE